MIWAFGQMDGLWTINHRVVASTKGKGSHHLKLRFLTQFRRKPVTYDELLLPDEAPGDHDRRGDLSE